MTPMRFIRPAFAALPRREELGELKRMLWLSLVIGVPTGVVAALFAFSIHTCALFFQQYLSHYTQPLPLGEGGTGILPSNPNIVRWMLFLVPAIGGLLSGFLVYRYAPEAEGHGTDQVIEAFHRQRGRIRARVPVVKIVASAITIGSGGSAGREGPVAQVGAGVGSFLAGLLHLSDRERRLMVVTGVAAGIGSIFQAPLGGAIFAVEVLYRAPEFEFEALIPCFVASILAYSGYCLVSSYGWGAIFKSQVYTFDHPVLLLYYLVLALLVFLVGRLFVRCFYFLRDHFFRPLRISNYFKPALGGLLLGTLALIFSWLTSRQQMGAVYGTGYGYLQLAINGQLTVRFMLLMALFRIVATSLTIGSGGSGGVFGPCIVIGGLVGGAFGQFCHLYFPHVVSPETASAFVLVGMAGFFAGAANVPVAALLMVSEMTAGYALLVPLMLVVAVAYTLASRRRSIYENQVESRSDSPAHTGEFVTDVLEGMKVSDILDERPVEIFPEGTTLKNILARITESRQSCFPVVNGEGQFIGLISLDDIRSAFLEPDLGPLLIAADLANPKVARIVENEPLSVALRKLVGADCRELPVVRPDAPNQIVGMLSYHDLVVAYNRIMQQQMGREE